MKSVNTSRRGDFFKPVLSSRTIQAAIMVLRPGQSSAEDDVNEHPKAEQWLFVVSGSGVAKISRRRCRIDEGTLVLIERGERHRITNTGKINLRTINFYAPPAYTAGGGVRSSEAR